ncbi:purine-cytosine permease family protein [Alicyclobacillus shizuokensis]|uniref:purine-cytosine permease family protein n=1 Tax=Alicyclobacillus shizuokensis TaxID=392014 RepID=UPI000832DC11|nr:cytosine permease [Alicyclobacillus shizuokensis]MCL6626205.1 cytosine permease [Alicyclobacillus shizuokensis]
MQMEQRSIEYIPEAERHGNVRNLFNIWFSANAQITTVVTGALATVLGLNLWWAIIAVVAGNAIGGIFMAYHSAQGPKLGVPQMIQSRAQFGVIGAVLPLVLVIVMYLGFFSTSSVLGAQALALALQIPQNLSLVIVNLAAVLLVTFGYDLIHRYERVVAILFLLLFIYLTIRLLQQPFPTHMAEPGFSWGPFLLVLSIMASWQLTYAPYVADYSRYLPSHTSTSATFWYTYLGSVIGSSWMMILGAIASLVAPKESEEMVAYFGHLAGAGMDIVVYLLIVLGVLAINTLNLYGGFMSVATTVSAFTPWRTTRTARLLFIVLVAAAGTAIAIWGQGNFLDNYSKFLLLLLYFMIPWTAINLVDFYLLRRGRYNIHAIFDLHGEYGKVNWIAILAYVVAVFIQFPFMNTDLYVGVLAKHMGGADIAWIVGLLVAAALYYFPMKARLSLNGTMLNQETGHPDL